jgi:capsular polysaccharide biosynthesis protein
MTNESTLRWTWWKKNFEIALYRNYMVHGKCQIERGLKFFETDGMSEARLDGRLEKAIAYCSRASYGYGHNMHDHLAPLFAFPKKVLEGAILITERAPAPFFLEGLKWFGLDSRVKVLKQGTCILVHLCYTTVQQGGRWFCPALMGRVRAKVRQLVKLDMKPPSFHGFMTRQGTRVISNMLEIKEMACLKYPEIQWTMMPKGNSSICENAKRFNEMRFVFGAHGAGMANCIFMQPGGVLCEVQSDKGGDTFTAWSRMFGLYHVVSRLVSMIHHSVEPVVLPMDTAVGMLDAAVRCLRGEI